MLVNAVSELEVLIKHGSQRERDRLHGLLAPCSAVSWSTLTLSIIYDVGGVSFGSLRWEETDGISRSSKQMPPKTSYYNPGVPAQRTDQEVAWNPSLEALMQKEGNGSGKPETCLKPP